MSFASELRAGLRQQMATIAVRLERGEKIYEEEETASYVVGGYEANGA